MRSGGVCVRHLLLLYVYLYFRSENHDVLAKKETQKDHFEKRLFPQGTEDIFVYFGRKLTPFGVRPAKFPHLDILFPVVLDNMT